MRQKNRIILISIIILIGILVFASVFAMQKTGLIEKIGQVLQREEIKDGISYIVYDNAGEKIKTLVTITKEDGIESIKYPENIDKNMVLQCNGKQQVSMDLLLESEKEYIFKVISNNTETEERITLAKNYVDEFIALKETNEQYYKVEIEHNKDMNQVSLYYKIGANANWVAYTDAVYGIDLEANNIRNEDGTITISAKKVDQSGNTVITSKNYDFTTITSDSILEAAKEINATGLYQVNVNNEKYGVEAYCIDGDLTLDGENLVNGSSLTNKVYEFGSKYNSLSVIRTYESGSNSGMSYAKSMVVLKVNGNLTINEGVTVTSCRNSTYGGPKGMLIYCTGTLTNNGNISMTARGAYAVGKNIYLWQNEDESYEYVPATGGAGGASVRSTSSNGRSGTSGTARRTAGGGSGAIWQNSGAGLSVEGAQRSGSGSAGTSYSGGSGGGGTSGYVVLSGCGNAAGNGAKGGSGGHVYSTNVKKWYNGGGGAGNPGGSGYGSGASGTGGLLIIYGNNIINNSTITSNGSNGGGGSTRVSGGGGSGAGSINIFYHEAITRGNILANGGAGGPGNRTGGAGGNGSITVGSIATGSFVSE